MTREEWLNIFEGFASNKKAIAIQDAEGNNYTYNRIYNRAKQIASTIDASVVCHIIHGTENEEDYCQIIAAWLVNKPYVVLPFNLPKKRKENILQSVQETEKDLTGAAYIVFTSGTTGQPKGVPIYWDQLSAFLNHYLNHTEVCFSKEMNWLQTYALNFDVSIFVFANCFATGGTLHLLPSKGIKYMKILSFLESRKINVVSNVATTARLAQEYLKEFDLSTLQYTFFSGEALYPQDALRWIQAMPNADHYNAYGPTETTIVCSEVKLNALPQQYFDGEQPLPIGKPFDSVGYRIAQKELLISGKQVFYGYLNEPKREFAFYSSGDIIEQDEKGAYIFKGRKDDQVQIQGFRVELMEVANSIQSITKNKTVCFYKNQELIAVIETNKAFGRDFLQAKLKQRLPDYMIPHRILSLSPFPLNNNQKTDKKAILRWISNQA